MTSDKKKSYVFMLVLFARKRLMICEVRDRRLNTNMF